MRTRIAGKSPHSFFLHVLLHLPGTQLACLQPVGVQPAAVLLAHAGGVLEFGHVVQPHFAWQGPQALCTYPCICTPHPCICVSIHMYAHMFMHMSKLRMSKCWQGAQAPCTCLYACLYTCPHACRYRSIRMSIHMSTHMSKRWHDSQASTMTDVRMSGRTNKNGY